MPTALARPPVRPPLQVASCWRPAHHRARRQHQIYIALAARPVPTSRDFVPWRFLDAGQLTARVFHCCRRPKTSTKHEVAALQPAAREREPRGREPGEKIVVAMESSRPENRVLQTSLRKELSMRWGNGPSPGG